MENYYYTSCGCGFVLTGVCKRITQKILKENLREKIKNGDKDGLQSDVYRAIIDAEKITADCCRNYVVTYLATEIRQWDQ